MNAPGTPTRPVGLLIAALGGEGGGVLCNWIVGAAETRGLPVQSTSIPGVAQRTGATTYYLEIWPETSDRLNGRRPILSLSAAPGDVDLVVASELLEAGRTLFQGFVTPDRTTLVMSTHRVFTTGEKIVEGDGRYDPKNVMMAAEARAKTLHAFDMQAAAEAAGAPISAIMLGALCAANVLPLSADDFRAAITGQGKAVEMNIRGFDAGFAAATAPVPEAPAAPDAPLSEESLQARARETFPAAVHDTLARALARLIDYQDAAYAAQYLDRLAPFAAAPIALLDEVARRLVQRMTYEDVIRVAQAKLRRGRMDRIRREAGAEDGEPVHVTDIFKPGIPEIADILPARWGERLIARAETDPTFARRNWELALRTDRFGGALRLWVLAQMRRWRRGSLRYRREQPAIDAWLADIADAAASDADKARELAAAASLIKGYGDTHARGTQAFEARSAEIAGAR